jgi:hypothetical protein
MASNFLKGSSMKRPLKITVQVAASLMSKSTLFVREGMRRGVLPIGAAYKLPGSTKWNFYISPTLLANYIGADLETVLEAAAQNTEKKAG